jgi:hypothetical protein
VSAAKPPPTHEGVYWGIPVWCSYDDDGLAVRAKFAPFDALIPAAAWLDATTGRICEWLNPNFEWTGFAFRIREIKESKK